MKAFIHENYLISIKSFISACFIHFLIFELFTFRVPTLAEPQKPYLIFLGSIYKNQDVAVISQDLTKSKKEIITRKPKIPSSSTKNFLSYFKSNKPLNTINHNQIKNTQKTTFLNIEQNTKESPIEEEGFNIKTEPETYRPLELDIE